MGNISRQTVFKILAGLATVVVVAAAIYFFSRRGTDNSEAVSERERDELVAEVSKLIILPPGETPTIATVSDLEALKGEPFFKNAQKGDKVLIYSEAKKAILYSVTLKKIIDVTALDTSGPGKPAL